MKFPFKIVISMMLLLLVACQPQPDHVKESGNQPDIYPDYVGVTVPAEIAPLNFAMTDEAVDWICVTVEGSKGGQVTSAGEDTDFDIDEWHQLLSKNKGGHLTVSVTARKEKQWTRYKSFRIYINPKPLGEWGITYRRIAPGYSMYGLMGIWQRCLSNFEEIPLLKTSQMFRHVCELSYEQQHAPGTICLSCKRCPWGDCHPTTRSNRTPESQE